MTGRQRKQLWGAVHTVLILVAMFVMLVPIVWIFLMSFQTNETILRVPPSMVFEPTKVAPSGS